MKTRAVFAAFRACTTATALAGSTGDLGRRPGAGAVGVACAGPLLQLGLASRLTLYDRDGDRARGEALDFRHAAPLLPECTIEGEALDSIRAADIGVLTAGVHTQPGQTRLDTLDHNLAVAIDVADALEEALPRVVIVVSSPVDVLTEYLTRRWESRPVHVFGTGTSLDSWRLRELLAVELGVHPGNVHAWVIGEHGDSAVFPFESARVGPFSLADYGRLSGRPLAAERLAEIEQQVRRAAYEVRALKGSTTHAIGLATAHLIRHVVRDADRLEPVSVRVGHRVCASLPAPIGANGAGAPLMPELSDPERRAWEESLAVLREANQRIAI
jgi:L-lactate dehydrogenase